MYGIQKAGMLKRISAFLLDFILMTIAVTGFAFLISTITGRENYVDKMNERKEFYEEKYTVDFDISEEDYNKLDENERKHIDDAYVEYRRDEEYLYAFNMQANLTLIMITFSLLLSYVILELVLPIIFGNGQTVGKKVFSIGIVHVNAVRLTGLGLFTRTMLGKYTVETMIPVILLMMVLFGGGGITGLLVLGLLLILELFTFFKNGQNTPIHDVLAHTVCVDLSVQQIYADEQELIKHKERLHAEQVQDSEYS